MKRSLLLGLFFICTALFSVFLAIEKVDRGKEDIVIVQEVLAGDPEAAAGVTLRIPSHWDGHLLWDTEYTVGSGNGAKSKFSYSHRQTDWYLPVNVSAALDFQHASRFGSACTDTGGYWSMENWETEPYGDILQEAVRQTAPGETYEVSIEIKDYYVNYPLVFWLEGHSTMYVDMYDEACGYLTEYFHIPTAGDRLELTVEKEPKGETFSFEGSVAYGNGTIVIADSSAEGDHGIYYAYCLEDALTREWVDRGQNQGIFYFPFPSAGDGIWHVDLTEVRKECELPEGAVPLEMKRDEGSRRLYLAVREKEGYSLCIYQEEEDGLALAQKIGVNRENLSGNFSYLKEIEDNKDCGEDDAYGPLPYFCGMFLTEGGVLLTWSDGSFSFAAEEEGRYERWCDGMFPAGQEGDYGKIAFPWKNVCVFDGERLVLAAYERRESLNVVLAVYGQEGQRYGGLYRHSSEGDWDGGFGVPGITPQGSKKEMLELTVR